MKYSESITKKVMNEFDLAESTITYRAFVEKICQKFVLKSKAQLVKFAFELFDHDSNGVICLQDLQVFSLHFGGACDVLMGDFRAIMDFLAKKRARLIAEGAELHTLQ